MANPHAVIVSRYVGWEWFANLSFKGKQVPSHGTRRKLVFAYLYEIAKRTDRPFPRLMWVLRAEKGGKTHRDHYHLLLGNAGLPGTIGNAHTLRWLWKQVGGGISVITPWDPTLAGADYVSKGLGIGRAAGNVYELERFGAIQDEGLEFSNSLVTWLDRRARAISEVIPGQTIRTPGRLQADAPRSDQETASNGHGETPF